MATPELFRTIPRDFEIYSAQTQDDLDVIQSMGFTQVILDDPALAQSAADMGFNIVLAMWLQAKDPDRKVVHEMVKLAECLGPRLVSVNMMDGTILLGLLNSHFIGLPREASKNPELDKKDSIVAHNLWTLTWLVHELFTGFQGLLGND